MSHTSSKPPSAGSRRQQAPAAADMCCPLAARDQPLGSRSGRRRRGWAASRAAVVATSVAGLVLLTPQAAVGAPVVSTPVKLSSPMQDAVSAIRDAQQQVTDINSAMPWLTQYDIDNQLAPYTKMMADMSLNFVLFSLNGSRGFDSNGQLLSPVRSAPAADPLPMMNNGNPDNTYIAPATGDDTWTMTIYPGPGTQDTVLSTMLGDSVTSSYDTARSYSLSQFTPNADGSYTITMSPTEQPGNWVDTQDSVAMLNRFSAGDWGLMQSSMTYHESGTPGYTMPVLSDDDIKSILDTIATNMVEQNATSNYIGFAQYFSEIPFNTMSDIITAGSNEIGPALLGQYGSLGRFELDPDEALIVKVPNLESAYSSIMISSALNNVGAQPGWASTVAGLNDTRAFQSSDGFTYYVISGKDPGVANWLDTDGLSNGDIGQRWQSHDPEISIEDIPKITTAVVPVVDVENYLPTDFPSVTAAERAANLQNHMLEYAYKVNQARNSGWVTQNLELGQIKAAIGTDEFNNLFGVQSDVPSVLDRMMDPSLMADPTTVIHHLLTTDPSETLSASVQNIPTLRQDIEMPMMLSALSLAMLMKQGVTATEFGTWLDSTFTDPATSITAGFLNARDDLSVVIMNADGYAPLTPNDLSLVSGKLSDLNISESNMFSAALAYVLGLGDSSAVFDPSQSALTSLLSAEVDEQAGDHGDAAAEIADAEADDAALQTLAGTGDAEAVLSAVVNAPATIVDGTLNGGYGPDIIPGIFSFPGLLSGTVASPIIGKLAGPAQTFLNLRDDITVALGGTLNPVTTSSQLALLADAETPAPDNVYATTGAGLSDVGSLPELDEVTTRFSVTTSGSSAASTSLSEKIASSTGDELALASTQADSNGSEVGSVGSPDATDVAASADGDAADSSKVEADRHADTLQGKAERQQARQDAKADRVAKRTEAKAERQQARQEAQPERQTKKTARQAAAKESKTKTGASTVPRPNRTPAQ